MSINMRNIFFRKNISEAESTKRTENSKMRQHRSIHRDWERQRANATGPSHLAEIDAIFSRYV
jgi:hypothetical protein